MLHITIEHCETDRRWRWVLRDHRGEAVSYGSNFASRRACRAGMPEGLRQLTREGGVSGQ